MLRLNLPPALGSSQRQKITVSFANTTRWRKAVGLPQNDTSTPQHARDDAECVLGKGKFVRKDTVTKHPSSSNRANETYDLIDNIKGDADSLDDTPTESDGDDCDDNDEDQSSNEDGDALCARLWNSDLDTLTASNKAELYFGSPLSGRMAQEKQLTYLSQQCSQRWHRYETSRGKGAWNLGIRGNRSTKDDHAPLNSLTTDEMAQILDHRQEALDILEGKSKPTQTCDFKVKTTKGARFAYFVREEKASAQAHKEVGVAWNDAISDARFDMVYKKMRRFYARERDVLVVKRRMAERKTTKEARARAKAIAAHARTHRGWAAISDDIGKALWVLDRERIEILQPLQDVFLLLMDKDRPDVIETAICIDNLNRRQLRHVYQVIENRGFRDVIWLCTDRNDWPCELEDDDSVVVLECPEIW